MDFKKFKNLNVNIKNIDVKINQSVWDKQPILYSNTDTIDGIMHNICVVRCGYLGLKFLLIDSQPTIQLYGTKSTINENLNALGLNGATYSSIYKLAEFND